TGERKTNVTLVIPHGIALTGKVTDKAGKALSGVAVEAVAAQNDPFGGQIRRMVGATERRGNDAPVTTPPRRTFPGRPKEGRYDVVFKREGYAAKTLRAQNVAPGEKPVEISLEPGVEISGRVTRAGAGVDGVNINAISELGNASAITGPDGSFALSD